MKKKIFEITLIFISITLVLIMLNLMLKTNRKNNLKLNFQNLSANIDELYIYGNHLNLKGTLSTSINISKLELILFNQKESKYELIFENNGVINFYISSKKNNGILLDELEMGNYIAYLKATTNNNEVFYYKLNNNTEYKETSYYTIRKKDKFNHILIEQDEYDTLNINIESSNDKNIYDVVIDAGHGGIDPGACYKDVCETDFTLELSKKLKDNLESYGLKVKLTRDDSIKPNQKFETYGKDGRIDRAMSSKAKYLFSFHLNSGLSTRSGIEVYTTNNIDYALAHSIAYNIVTNTNTDYSNNPIFNKGKGIYTRTFQNYEISDMKKDASKEKYEPYNITTNTTYYYIIRETGGFMTGAYSDGRSGDLNLYYNTNVGLESYIIELGYITNLNDTKNIKNDMDKYIEAISKAIRENICE